jgi:hypothetical protein
MLIDYSIRSFEVLERKMNDAEKEEVFRVFHTVGDRMGVSGLPENFKSWKIMRRSHLRQNLLYSKYTSDLFCQYRKHLGAIRFWILKEAQSVVAPTRVRELLRLSKVSPFRLLIALYKIARLIRVDSLLKALILPPKYKSQINSLDNARLSLPR